MYLSNRHSLFQRCQRTLFIQLIYSCFRRHVPTNGAAPLSAYKHKHKQQFLHSLRRRANAQTFNFKTLFGSKFTLLSQLIILNYLVLFFHPRGSTVSLDPYPFFHLSLRRFNLYIELLKFHLKRDGTEKNTLKISKRVA